MLPRLRISGVWRPLVTVGLIGLACLTTSCDSGHQEGVGSPAPDFEFQPLGGKTKRLSDFRGKPVIVNFFATWCGPCMQELPQLDRKIARPLADRGLVVIAIGIDQRPSDVADFERTNDYRFLFATDPESTIFQQFTRQESIPQTFLIKPDGTIGLHLVGYEPNDLQTLKRKVEELLPSAK
ncbi:MAG: TlpA family protein disulfide reductase [Planctomycetes bacterium]|nr:TlpA family protein disulfide reductase [Planctomycetota bacterium]